MKRILGLVVGVSMIAGPAAAQTGGGASAHVAVLKTQAEAVRALVVRTAEKVPEDLYSFKPTPEIRSLGAVIGHIADGNNLLCSMANGEKPNFNQANEKKTTRAELVAALKASFAACDKVFDATTDANASTPVDLFGQK